MIRDKELLPEAMKRLAVLEDHLEETMEVICEGYCKYPYVCPNQATLDHVWQNDESEGREGR